MKSPRIYSIGRVVMYVPAAQQVPKELPETYNGNPDACAATIVNAWDGHEAYQQDSKVNLKVICDGPQDVWRTSVPYSEGKEPGTWHWPPLKP